MHQHVPNMLTLLRLLLAGVFFVVLNQYRFVDRTATWALLVAIIVFICATVTDALDGYLARKWKVESLFGRIMDPFCDKVLVIGAFVYLTGPRMAAADGTLISGVYPWMVVVILARELLVTSVRGVFEAKGIDFGAMAIGKWKMVFQSVIIPIVLFIAWLDPTRDGLTWLGWVRDAVVYLTVVITVISGLPYITRSLKVAKG